MVVHNAICPGMKNVLMSRDEVKASLMAANRANDKSLHTYLMRVWRRMHSCQEMETLVYLTPDDIAVIC